MAFLVEWKWLLWSKRWLGLMWFWLDWKEMGYISVCVNSPPYKCAREWKPRTYQIPGTQICNRAPCEEEEEKNRTKNRQKTACKISLEHAGENNLRSRTFRNGTVRMTRTIRNDVQSETVVSYFCCCCCCSVLLLLLFSVLHKLHIKITNMYAQLRLYWWME